MKAQPMKAQHVQCPAPVQASDDVVFHERRDGQTLEPKQSKENPLTPNAKEEKSIVYCTKNTRVEQMVRSDLKAKQESSSVCNSVDSEPLHTGISIQGVNFHPEDLEEGLLHLVKKFVDETYQNSDYESLDEVVLRARSFFNNIDAERSINEHARESMEKAGSAIAEQSGHMVHLMRGLWSKVEIDSETREKLSQELLTRNEKGELAKPKLFNWIFEDAKKLHALLVGGIKGPLTMRDSQFGVEAVFATKEIAQKIKELNSPILKDLTQSVFNSRVKANRGGTDHFRSHGANLSQDIGTKIRDELGLPVMLGTSRTASNVVAATKFVADNLNVSMWASSITEEEAKDALIDATFHFLREQVVPKVTKPVYDQLRQGLGAEPKNVDPFMIYTHSYPEVRAGAEMTLNGEHGDDELAMRRSSERAKEKLDSVR